MELKEAEKIALELRNMLAPVCQRIVVAGSIRRRKPQVRDIELLAIPKFVDGIDQLDKEIGRLIVEGVLGLRLNKRGHRAYGPKNKLLVHRASGIGLDVFSTDEQCWYVSLVVRTGGKATNQRIATAALRKGWQFHAYGRGFTTPKGEWICLSEQEVFEAVGLPYVPPWERE